jgi:uncharacterized protein (DUF433 family)/DNA-binding transcriptional MerR regulator
MVHFKTSARPKPDVASGGFYTVKEAARLLNIGQPSRITAWLQGRANVNAGPVLARQYAPIDGKQELGFWDLIEVRFIDHFRKQGISLQSLRRAAETARRELNQQHPFATSRARFMTDRKTVFLATAKELNDTTLLDLVTRQFAMYEILEEIIERGLDFHTDSGLAREWRPRPVEYPGIVLNPRIAFGQPSIARIPTSALFNAWRAETGDYGAVAAIYDISEIEAQQGVEFELGLAN